MIRGIVCFPSIKWNQNFKTENLYSLLQSAFRDNIEFFFTTEIVKWDGVKDPANMYKEPDDIAVGQSRTKFK